ncbi:MAG: class I SAM-dependent methyltransferase [Myxococcales bacterium]|nr:class I SAM-dependent methyltransferase [Myxococcales bacterium]
MRPLHPERCTEKILRGSPIPLLRWPAFAAKTPYLLESWTSVTPIGVKPLLYERLVRFYHLLDPLEDHIDESEAFGALLNRKVPQATSLLELGAGVGHGAYFIKSHFSSVTLTDRSDLMLDRSRILNPDCKHIVGDMRNVRLNNTFGSVLCHDAIAYMTTKADLQCVFETAHVHLCSGGAALFVPDCLKDTFIESHEAHAGDDKERSLRCISWSYDPDPSDDTHIYDFAFLLREHGEVTAVHDRHICGLFLEETWLELARKTGFHPEVVERPLPEAYEHRGYTNKMFLLHKPG